MKRWFFLFAVALSSLVFSAPIQDHRIDPEALASLAIILDSVARWIYQESVSGN